MLQNLVNKKGKFQYDNPLFSQGRLKSSERVACLKRVLIRHGALGYIPTDPMYATPPSEMDNLQAVPLVFGLLPAAALTRAATTVPSRVSSERT